MVSSEYDYSVFESDFKSDEKSYCLHAVMPSIDVVPHEQIVGLRYFPSYFKEFHEIVKLAVDISANNDWSSDGDNVGLLC